MKSITWFLLIFISLLHLMIPVHTQASKDSSVNKKIQEALNSRSHHLAPSLPEPKKLSCMSVSASGRWASCPAGMAVTGCACGYGCGSWDVQNGITCHCQCAGMDWTAARCCQLV
ncbi:resistin-like beta [Microtus pennsylvanicus]|uniref:resistin-like beta n=1 Tax=Microtus pennsylvanicus TaxID=10058 RepID=UPI003F6C8DA1